MTAAAYRHADGGRPSPELRLAAYIREFGVEAVMHRPYLGYGEMLRIRRAEALVASYNAWKAAANWQEFSSSNPELAQDIFNAQQAAKELYGWE